MAAPRLVYDDDCGFCMWCTRWALRFGEFEPVGFAELTPDQRARLPENWEDCMHLLTDDAVYSCGEGLEQTAAHCGLIGRTVIRVLRKLPKWEAIRERGYRWVADRRAIWGRYASCQSITKK